MVGISVGGLVGEIWCVLSYRESSMILELQEYSQLISARQDQHAVLNIS